MVLRGSFIVDGADQRVALADRLVTLPNAGTSEPNFPQRLRVFLALSSGRRGVLRQFDAQLAGSAHVRQHGGCDDQFQATVAASEEWVALTTARSQDCPEGAGDFIIPGAVVVSASSYSGNATVVERCSAASQAFGEGDGLKGSISGQLDGSVLAYESCDQRSIVVRDLGEQSPPAVVSIGEQVRDFTLAGDYVAVEAAPAAGPPTQVGVYRWRDGTLVGRFGGAVINRFAVDRHGTLATIYGGSSVGCMPGYSLAVLRIGQPAARVLPLTPCADLLSIVDGQILFERLLAPGTARVPTTEDIAVTDVNGSQTRGVLPPQIALDYSELVDFAPSGELRREVAGCGDSDAYQFDPLAQLPAAPPRLPPCHAYFTGPGARLRNGVLSVRLRCPYGCGGTISLRVARTGRLLRFTQTPTSAISFFAPPGVQDEGAMLSQTSRRLVGPGARLIASLVVYTAGAAQDPTAPNTVAGRGSHVLTVR